MRRVALLLIALVLAGGVRAQTLRLDPTEMAWLERNAVPLAGTSPDLSPDDLAFLDAFVGDARIVALGEASHGNREFRRIDHRITRYLVEELGFTHVVLEQPWLPVEALDRYVVDGEGDLRTVLRSLWPLVTDTEEMRDVVEWARAFNDSGAGLVRFGGLDLHRPPDTAIAEVLDFIRANDPAWLAQAHDAYAFADRLAPDLRNWPSLAPEWRAGAERVLTHLTERREAYAAMGVPVEEIERARRDARFALQGALVYYDTLPSRDESMAANVVALLERNPDARLVIWAHNSHVAEDYRERRGGTRMGEVLAERYGDDYRTVGTVFHEGAYQRFDPDARSYEVTPLEPLPDGYLGPQLHRLGTPLFFLSLRDAASEPGAAWTRELQSARMLGTASPPTHARPLVPAAMFDGLVFVERVTPSRFLPSAAPERR